MGSMTVTEEAVAALKQLSTTILDEMNATDEAYKSLTATYEANSDKLGAHSDSIKALLNDVEYTAKEAFVPLKYLSLKLSKAAALRTVHIETDSYASIHDISPAMEKEGFKTDIAGLRGTLDIGPGAAGVQQLSGAHKDVQKKEEKGYESHHIPSQAVLKEYGVDTNEWPTIALTKEDHAKTDSYRGKQRKTTEYVFSGGKSEPYKKEAAELLGRPGGLFELVRDEILNIKAACGDKYDSAIDEYLKRIVEYVNKHGIPKKK